MKDVSSKSIRLGLGESPLTPVVSGSVSGSLEKTRVAVPADVRVNGEFLEWIFVDGDARGEWWPEGSKAHTALPAFLRLANERDPQRIAQFARKYGVLGLTSMGVPACGSATRLASSPHTGVPWKGCAVSWEPIEAYRFYSGAAKAIVVIGSALKYTPIGTLVRPKDLFANSDLPIDDKGGFDRFREVAMTWQRASGLPWDEWWETKGGHQLFMNLSPLDPSNVLLNLSYSPDIFGPMSEEEFARLQRQKYAYWFTEHWLKRANLVPTMTWMEKRARLELAVGSPVQEQPSLWPSNSLFKILVTHLASFICSGDPTASCDNCGMIYFPARKVRFDQPHYCDTCKITAPSRRTKRWRENRNVISLSQIRANHHFCAESLTRVKRFAVASVTKCGSDLKLLQLKNPSSSGRR